jgi:hypothetical protein
MAKTEAIRDQAIPLDPTVRALGVVSLLNDFSNEVAVRTLPLFLTNALRKTEPVGMVRHDI